MVRMGGVIFLHGTAEFLDRAKRRHRKVEEGMVAKNRNWCHASDGGELLFSIANSVAYVISKVKKS